MSTKQLTCSCEYSYCLSQFSISTRCVHLYMSFSVKNRTTENRNDNEKIVKGSSLVTTHNRPVVKCKQHLQSSLLPVHDGKMSSLSVCGLCCYQLMTARYCYQSRTTRCLCDLCVVFVVASQWLQDIFEICVSSLLLPVDDKISLWSMCSLCCCQLMTRCLCDLCVVFVVASQWLQDVFEIYV